MSMYVPKYVEWYLRQIRETYELYAYLARDCVPFCKLECLGKSRKGNLGEPGCQEKRRGHAGWCSYRKPTQVDEERILRRPDQCSLRNSAKKQVYLRYIPCPFACWVMEILVFL